MESADIHHHQLQDQILGSSSSSSLATNGWIPTSTLNTNGFTSYPNQTILNPREQAGQQIMNVQLSSSYYSPMASDMTFNYANQDSTIFKEEFSDNCYLKYTELLSSTPSSSTTDELSHRNLHYSNDIPTKFLLKRPFFSGDHISSYSSANGPIYASNFNLEGFTDRPASSLEPLDLLTSSQLSGNFSPSCLQNQIGINYNYSINDHMQPYDLMPLYSSSNNKVSANSSNGAAEGKRTSSKMELKTLQTATANKKPRLQTRPSCQPFKVRKEKLGDRIAALQQLVAPFGKTDTASVLMEAIGYIKFLQTQVETLSVPYMKTSRNKTSRLMKAGPTEDGSEGRKRDLKSRGLCLVPLACMSYITDGGGAVVWPPSHFGGATE